MFAILVLCLVACIQLFDSRHVSRDTDQCTSLSNCPFTCPGNNSATVESDILAFLAWPFHFQNSAKALYNNVASAIAILRSFGNLNSQDQYYLHATTNYLCCYTTSDYEQQIVPALNAVKWAPFNVTYDRLVCNFDNATNGPAATTISLILLLSEQSQIQLGALVKQFEQAIAATGLPVYPRSRMEKFHTTVAVVSQSYPVYAALAKVNDQITAWTDNLGPITISTLESLTIPFILFAQ